jgi:RNA polymerase sigma-70 factor (ECF subfamily)
MVATAALLTALPPAAHNRGESAMAESDHLDRLPDSEFVLRVRARGDRGAFEQLYRRHRRRVLAVLLGLLHDPAAAEDLCHDTFLNAWSGLRDLRGEFEPWVVRIASNLALNHLRQRATHRRLELAIDSPQPEPPPESTAAACEAGRLVVEILSALGAEQRRAMALRYLDGLSHAEIVARTGDDENAVRSHLQNGRRNFHIAWQLRTASTKGVR